MEVKDTIFVAGHQGMVGSAVVRNLRARGFSRILSASRDELDLCDRAQVDAFFTSERPDIVVIAAARVGGIHANATYPAEFLYENLAIAMHVIHAAHESCVARLLFLGSSCIYPRDAAQPMAEGALLTGRLEKTNEAYAVAKIAGMKLCQYYRKQYGDDFHSAMPTSLYGPRDNYHPENSHVIPALIRRFHEAKSAGWREVVLWGSGSARREFLHVDDLAAAVVQVLEWENPPDWVNVGSGTDVTIRQLAEMIGKVVGFNGEMVFDTRRPDGTPRKLLDISLLTRTGWVPRIPLEVGLKRTYAAFLSEQQAGVLRARI